MLLLSISHLVPVRFPVIVIIIVILFILKSFIFVSVRFFIFSPFLSLVLSFCSCYWYSQWRKGFQALQDCTTLRCNCFSVFISSLYSSSFFSLLSFNCSYCSGPDFKAMFVSFCFLSGLFCCFGYLFSFRILTCFLSGLLRLRVQSWSRTRLRIASSVAFLFRRCSKEILETIAPLLRG